jgi:hypothetical protein
MGIDIFISDCLLGLGYFYIKRRRMTKQEIIRMAQEAQMPFYWRTGEITYLDKLERFAALVVSAERERCVARADIALLGADITLRDRVLKAINIRKQA